MESIGEKIRKIREEKGYSLDQVARDTHITRRFLEALEDENFTAMPGESYVIGFMRSYAEYLGLNPDELVVLYKNMKLQEQPAPMTELLERPRMSLQTIIAISVVVAMVIVAGTILIVSGSQSTAQSADAMPLTPKQVADNKGFQNDVLERSFASGETIRIPVNGVDMDVLVAVKESQVLLTVSGNMIALPLQKEDSLDLNQDGKMDIKVLVKEIDTKPTPARAVLRFDRVVQSPQTSSIVASPLAIAGASPAPVVAGTVSYGSTNQTTRMRQAIAIPEYTDQTISATVRFSGSSVFRYETDSGKREERLVGSGEAISMSSVSWIRIWTANAGHVTIKVGGKEFKAGAEGEVSAWAITWATGTAGARQLQLVPMY